MKLNKIFSCVPKQKIFGMSTLGVTQETSDVLYASGEPCGKTRFTNDGRIENVRIFKDGEAFKIYTDPFGNSTLGIQKPGMKHKDYAKGDEIDL